MKTLLVLVLLVCLVFAQSETLATSPVQTTADQIKRRTEEQKAKNVCNYTYNSI